MTYVPTARGDFVDSAELGYTLTAEELIAVCSEVQLNWPDQSWGDDVVGEERIAAGVKALNWAKDFGVDTIVDGTVAGLGRDIKKVAALAAQTSMNIIVSTGLFLRQDLPRFFRTRERWAGSFEMTGPSLEDLFVGDIEDGIAGTGIKPGLIICGSDADELTPGVRCALRATSGAHRRTGAPIIIQADGASTGLLIQDVLEQEGVDLTRVVIGGLDLTPGDGLEEVMRVAERGSFASFDRLYATPLLGNADSRVRRIVTLCDRGFEDQVLISSGDALFNDLMPERWWNDVAFPYPRFTNLQSLLLPELRDRGISEIRIEKMMVKNPRRFFESRDLGPY